LGSPCGGAGGGAGRYMGTALYYPALEVLGLVEAARKCFRLPRSELFGVRAVTLTLVLPHLAQPDHGGGGQAPAPL